MAPDFCKRLAEATGIRAELLGGAWWATDFHFDWLAGALLTFIKGVNGENLSRQGNSNDLVAGNQEDIDLVVVAPDPDAGPLHHLILIEAKAYGHFTTGQYRSKVARLEKLYAFYTHLEEGRPGRVRFHYVLYSPTKPTKLVPIPLPWPSNDVTVPPIQHIELKLGRQRSSMLSVTRCNESDKPDSEGNYWKCIKVSLNALSPSEDATSELASLASLDGPIDGE